MRRDVVVILGITIVVIVSVLVLAPQLSRIDFAGARDTHSIPVSVSDEDRQPLAEPSVRPPKRKEQFVNVTGTLCYSEWGNRIAGNAHLEWEVRGMLFASDVERVDSDGVIDLSFKRPPFPFRVLVYGLQLEPSSGWRSEIINAPQVDVGEVRVDVHIKPVLLSFVRHYGQTRPDGGVTIWSLEGGDPKYVANEGDAITPGSYLIRYTNVIPTWYHVVELGSEGIEVHLPREGGPRVGDIEVALMPPVEGPPTEALVIVHAHEPYGFKRRMGASTTGTTGETSFRGLPRGRYTVTVDYGDAPLPLNAERTFSTDVEISGPGEERLEFGGYALGEVSVRMTLRGEPLVDRTVSVQGSGGPFEEWPFNESATTDGVGVASFGLLKWGQADVVLDDNWRSSVPVAGTSDVDNMVSIDLQPEGTGNLRGRLNGASGVNLAPGLSLVLSHDETGEQRQLDWDKDLRFAMMGLPLGHYQLRAEWRTSGEWYFERFKTLNWHFRVSDQEALTLNFEVAYGGVRADVTPFLDPRIEQKYEIEVVLYSLQEKRVGWLRLRPDDVDEFCEELAPGRYALLVSSVDRSFNVRRIAWATVNVVASETVPVEWKILAEDDPWPQELPVAPR